MKYLSNTIKKVSGKRLFLFVLSLLIAILPSSKVLADTNVIYGDYDDREQYYDLEIDTRLSATDIPYFKELATSVCMITLKSYTAVTLDGKTKLYLDGTLYDRILADYDGTAKLGKVCDNTHFKNEYMVPECGTGTLINNNSVLTAYHVVSDFVSKGSMICIFNYYKSKKDDFPVKFDDPVTKKKPYVLVNTSDVYDVSQTANQLIRGNYTAPYDFAVITLSKNADSKQKRMCFYSKTDILSKLGVGGNEMFTWGFPMGLPMIFTDDSHLRDASNFKVDIDIYSGNSGGPVFVKINSNNTSDFNYKIVGVISSSKDQDYVPSPGSGCPTNCNCWVDNNIKPNQPADYITISFMDQINSVSGVLDNSCTIPWVKPVVDPPTPSKQKTLGQSPVIKFTPNISAMHVIKMLYTQNNNEFYNNQISGCTKGVQQNVTMQFLPRDMKYTYQVWAIVSGGVGGTVVLLTSGTGQASGLTWGSPNPALSTSIGAMAFVGNAPVYPYKTLKDAIANAPSGYTLHVARGVYNENVIITKPLKIIGDNNGCTMVVNKGTTPAITIQSSDVSIENVYFDNADGGGAAISLSNVTRCSITNNFITTGYSPAIVLQSNCTGNTITGNSISGASTIYGIVVNASTGNTLTNNVVDFGVDAFNFIGCTPQNNTVSGNTIANIVWTGQTVNSAINDVKAKNSITIRSDNINSGGKVNFIAGQKVNISPETKILPGAEVKIKIDPTLQ
jgi:V8-like Glu-specific endopeptidase